MNKKEEYRNILPHFQQPGQAYFVTWSLYDAIPKKALLRYTQNLHILKSNIEFHKKIKSEKSIIEEIQHNYYLVRKKYIKAYDDLLDTNKNPSINLSNLENTKIIKSALLFWEGKKLNNFAFSIMPNHVHWVFQLLETDDKNNLVYLQDILHSVKRHTSNKINKIEERTGTLWQKESFDTTVRNEKHLYYAVEYTLNNPVKAGLVTNREKWPGNWSEAGCGGL